MMNPPSARIAVVTDSAASIPASVAAAEGVHVVPLELAWEGETYLDGEGLTPTEFYRRFATCKSYPTTSAPSPGQFIALYERLAGQVEGILSVHLPDRLSSTADVARAVAKEMRSVPIEVFVASTACMSQGFVALAAGRAAREGATLAEAVAVAQAHDQGSGMLAMLTTLEHLHRGGRIGEAATLLATRLRINPILAVINGHVRVAGVTRSVRSAEVRMLDQVARRVQSRPVRVSVFHADMPEDAERMLREAAERLDCVESFISEFTPVMGAHTGPGVLGIGYCLADPYPETLE